MNPVTTAKLLVLRRTEMEDRIASLLRTRDLATRNMERLKDHAKGFVNQLNCDHPAEFRQKFLGCMKKLDEYIYMVTEFNLSIERLGIPDEPTLDEPTLDEPTPDEPTPDHPISENQPKGLARTMTPVNLFDALSDPAPSTSSIVNLIADYAIKRRIKKLQKQNQLIDLSSASCSEENIQNMSPHSSLESVEHK